MNTYTIEQVRKVVGGTPWMRYEWAQLLDDIIKRRNLSAGLDLGTFHGVSACYLGASLSTNNGTVLTVDLEYNKSRKPHVSEFITRLDASNISYIESVNGAAWEMFKMVRICRQFDFIYVDSHHTFEESALSFYLADRLLKVGGVIAFDDVDWCPQKEGSEAYVRHARKQADPEYRQSKLHEIEEVVNVLVRHHGNYGEFLEVSPATGVPGSSKIVCVKVTDKLGKVTSTRA